LAERPNLITRLFDINMVNPYGIYVVWLFIDGKWKEYVIDDYLPSNYIS
jgi:calpain-15